MPCDCPCSRRVWENLLPRDKVQVFFALHLDLVGWLALNLKVGWVLPNGLQWSVVFGAACWDLWKHRNDIVFKGVGLSIGNLAVRVMANAQLYEATMKRLGTVRDHGQQHRVVSWQRPPSGVCKLNTDASLDVLKKAYGGGAFHNEHGTWSGGFVVKIGVCPVLLAELWSILYGIQHAINLGITKLQVESDSLLAVQMINGQCRPSAVFVALVQTIQTLSSAFEEVSFCHVHREANMVADSLSRYAFSFPLGFHPISMPPSDVLPWLTHDGIGATHLR